MERRDDAAAFELLAPTLDRGTGTRRRRRTVAPKLARNAPRAGGWNEADRDVTGTWRIPVTGLTQGLANDSAQPATREEAQHRAVAIVPDSVSNTNLEVLLHFHGNNLGERERRTASSRAWRPGRSATSRPT